MYFIVSQKKLRLKILLCSFLVTICIATSCKNKTSKETPEDIVTYWIGKTIKFPPDVLPTFQGKTAINSLTPTKPFKVLVYTDSVGCTSCKLRMDLWKSLIEEIDSTMAKHLEFVFYFNPKKMDELPSLLEHENFKNPVHIDRNDQINQLNQFPKKMEYQCFLLDRNNKILLVGNPTLKPKVWSLYKQQILDSLDDI